MYLYYTVISANEAEQVKPGASLGGFKSSTRVANSKIGNLFSDISTITIANYNQPQYIGLILKNELGANKTNLKMWFEYPEKCYSKFKVAVVDMATDSSGNLQMEYIQDNNSQPLNGEFYEANGEVNKLDLGNIASNEQLGIWIERSLLLEFIKEDQSKVYEPDLANEGRYLEVELTKEDDIKVCFSWD